LLAIIIGVSFISIAVSEFVEIFVGVEVSREFCNNNDIACQQSRKK